MLVPLVTLHWFLLSDSRLRRDTKLALNREYKRYRAKKTTRMAFLAEIVRLVGPAEIKAIIVTLSRREQSLRRSNRVQAILRASVVSRMSAEA